MELGTMIRESTTVSRAVAVAGISLLALSACSSKPNAAPEDTQSTNDVATGPATVRREAREPVTAPEPEPATEIRLVRDSHGPQVVKVQKMFMRIGCNLGPDGADGWYRTDTITAAAEFQRNKKLEDDGATGPFTYRILAKSVKNHDKHCGAPSGSARKINHANVNRTKSVAHNRAKPIPARPGDAFRSPAPCDFVSTSNGPCKNPGDEFRKSSCTPITIPACPAVTTGPGDGSLFRK